MDNSSTLLYVVIIPNIDADLVSNRISFINCLVRISLDQSDIYTWNNADKSKKNRIA